MRTKLGFAVKHVINGVEKVNVLNCLTRPLLPPVVEYYYEEDVNYVND